jgi:hypothetical protein
MRSNSERDAAIECLKLAVSAVATLPVPSVGEIVPLASDFYEFVTGDKQPTDAEASR